MDPERYEFLKRDFKQGFPAWVGYEVDRVGEGEFETSLKLEPHHLQQDGLAHAGVMATMADHSAGYAAFTLAGEGMRILSVEFKVNFMRPAKGPRLICRARVIKPGRKIVVAESEVFSKDNGQETLCTKATVTLMQVPAGQLDNNS